MPITNSTAADIDEIFRLYAFATHLQQQKNVVAWPVFERSLVETEINECRQWKLTEGQTIACVWATTFSDPLIWQEKNNDPAVYIHRIAVSPAFRGMHMVKQIADCAKEYAAKENKHYIRLDTVGENRGLIKHYTNCGFTFLGLSALASTTGLPAHYHNASVSLFEMAL